MLLFSTLKLKKMFQYILVSDLDLPFFQLSLYFLMYFFLFVVSSKNKFHAYWKHFVSSQPKLFNRSKFISTHCQAMQRSALPALALLLHHSLRYVQLAIHKYVQSLRTVLHQGNPTNFVQKLCVNELCHIMNMQCQVKNAFNPII